MSYKSKYTGLQIDDILDSVEGKQNEIEDLASIRSGAAKGATALQSYTEQYKGTITGVSANGTSIATNGVANIPAASTSKYGVTKLNSATNSTSTTEAATASAVKAVYDLANGKQDKLVSGTNIKTINGTSILGSGDITVAKIENFGETPSLDNVAAIYNPIDGLLYGLPGSQSTGDADDHLLSVGTVKTINGESILGSGDITISGGGDYLPSAGGDIDGALQVNDDLTVMGTIASPTLIMASGGVEGYIRKNDCILGIENENIIWGKEANEYYITAKGDGTKFLSNDGTYKTISSGGSSSGGSGAYAEVNHGTSDTTFTLTPNTFHVWDEVSSLTLTLGSETSGVANEYLFQFNSGATATVLTLPDDIKWANDTAPTIIENMIYQVSILKGLASVLEFSNAPTLIENHITYDEGDFMNGGTISFEYPTASELTFGMDYYGSGTLIVPQGSTQVNVEWYEPSAPIIRSVSPTEDSIYKYIL